MLCVRAPAFEERLVFLAKRTGKSKSYFVRLALQTLFREMDKSIDFIPIEFSSEPPLDFARQFISCQSVMQE